MTKITEVLAAEPGFLAREAERAFNPGVVDGPVRVSSAEMNAAYVEVLAKRAADLGTTRLRVAGPTIEH